MVGAEAFACGKTYSGIGASNSTLTPSDFAMFVHDVRLVTRDGREAAVTLDQDSLYQNGSLALLDFEDGSGPCLNGNAATHTAVTGTVAEGDYTSVRFVIGVPFERNHRDLATQPSPLSVTRMFWAWNSGHKFVRLDAKASTGKNWVLHLGSTGCTPSGGASIVPTTCAQANRLDISLDRFNADTDVIVADAARLFAGNGTNGDSSQVCMSSPRSGACRPMFSSLGLAFNDAAASVQKFLSVAPAATKADER
jgi:uncharacterized repeat protein (TIGR04052 family)